MDSSLRLVRSGRLALPANSVSLLATVPVGGTANLAFTVACNSVG